jgi:hypothetical protein
VLTLLNILLNDPPRGHRFISRIYLNVKRLFYFSDLFKSKKKKKTWIMFSMPRVPRCANSIRDSCSKGRRSGRRGDASTEESDHESRARAETALRGH